MNENQKEKDIRTAFFVIWILVWGFLLYYIWTDPWTFVWIGFLWVFIGQLKTKLDMIWITKSVRNFVETLQCFGNEILKEINNKEDYRS